MSIYEDRIKLPFQFNQARMLDDLKRLECVDWVEHFVKDNFDGEWSILPLRGPKGETHPIRMSYSDPSQTDFVDTPFLQQTQYFPTVLNTFQCPVKSARLMKLSPGSVIKKHTDLDLSAESGEARLHIPVLTNAKVSFYLNDKHVFMGEGECWYLRLTDPHFVNNFGNDDRIHLVIDVVVNAWLKGLLDGGSDKNNILKNYNSGLTCLS